MPDLTGYEWADGDNESVALGFCVCLARGLDPVEALNRLVPKPSTPLVSAIEAREWAAVQEITHFGTSVEAEVRGEWTLTIELRGFQATRQTRLEPLSEGTRAISLFTNVNAAMEFSVADEGAVVRAFDPLLGTQLVGSPLPQESMLPFGIEAPKASGLALLEGLTGISLRLEDLRDPGTRQALGLAH